MAVVNYLFRGFRSLLELVPSLVPVNRCNISLKKMCDTRSPRVSLLIRHTICTTVVHTWLFNAIIHHALRNNLQLNRYDRFSSSRQLDRGQWRLLFNEKKSSWRIISSVGNEAFRYLQSTKDLCSISYWKFQIAIKRINILRVTTSKRKFVIVTVSIWSKRRRVPREIAKRLPIWKRIRILKRS